MMHRKATILLACVTLQAACTPLQATQATPPKAQRDTMPDQAQCEAFGQSIQGMSYEAAVAAIQADGRFSMRKVQEDDRLFMGTRDFRPDRLNLTIMSNQIIKANCN